MVRQLVSIVVKIRTHRRPPLTVEMKSQITAEVWRMTLMGDCWRSATLWPLLPNSPIQTFSLGRRPICQMGLRVLIAELDISLVEQFDAHWICYNGPGPSPQPNGQRAKYSRARQQDDNHGCEEKFNGQNRRWFRLGRESIGEIWRTGNRRGNLCFEIILPIRFSSLPAHIESVILAIDYPEHSYTSRRN